METVIDRQLQTEVLAEIKRNYALALLCILPGIEDRAYKLKSCAKKLLIEGADYERYARMLFDGGLWRLKGKRVEANFELLDLGDLSIKDYMAMTIHIMSRLNGDRAHEYEYLSLATSRDLVRAFVAKVRKGLNELYRESEALGFGEKDSLFSWAHTGVVEIEIAKGAEDKDV